MENKLSKEKVFLQFAQEMQPLTNSIAESLSKINQAISTIAEEFGIGRLTIGLVMPGTIITPTGENDVRSVYDWGAACEDEPFTFQAVTGEKGLVSIEFYPRKGITWDEEMKQVLNVIGNAIFVDSGGCRKTELLQKVVITDLQTGLLNMAGLRERVYSVKKQGELHRFSLVYYNIRNFKYVNKAIGYLNCNQVLTKYTKKMLTFIESPEAIARLGGDNFVAFVYQDNLNRFLQLLQDVKIEIEVDGQNRAFILNVVCGIYNISADSEGMGEIMMAVSSAYQEARNRHLPIVYFTEEMYRDSLLEREVQFKFPSALANHEFIVYYQPKVNLENNSIIGAEALARWNENGIIRDPSYFISVLEREGTICSLDFYILDCVCQKIRRWLDAKKEPIMISVNFSRCHLKNANFPSKVFEILDNNKVPGKYIEIEVTETLDNEDFQALLSAIDKLKEHEIQVSIDDFGTGYSSLTMLRQIPADILKMDKSFLNEEIHERDKKMLDYIVSMAKDLSMVVLAEGVENESQRDYLRDIGCDAVQGFLYDKPLPEEEFDKRLELDFKYSV